MTLFSLVDSPASPTPLQGSEKERTTLDISGQRCLELLEKSNQHGSWVKMFTALLIGQTGWFSMRCILTWKQKASKSKRLFFQLQVSTPRTDGIEFGLLRTPAAQEPGISVERLVTKDGQPAKIGERAYDKHTGRLAQVGVIQQVQMGLLPTPQAIDGNGQGRDLRLKKDCNRDPEQPGSWRGDLKDFAAKGLLPTPLVSNVHHAERIKKLKEAGAETMASRKLGASRPNGLIDYLDFNGMLPTPKTQDSRHALKDRGKSNLGEEMSQWGQDNGIGSQLNPPFVAEMMGFPPNWTELPFLNGETNPLKPTETP